MNKKKGRLYHQYGEQISERRKILLGVFKDLRKAGILARANYKCCSSCASSGLWYLHSEMSEEQRNKVRGGAFWHSQSEDDIWNRGQVHIGYGSLGIDSDDTEEADVAIGQEIFSALESAGLAAVWDGKAIHKILVPLLPPDVFSTLKDVL